MEFQTWDKACQVNGLFHKGITAIEWSLDGFSSLTLRKTSRRGRFDTVSCLRRCHGIPLVKDALLRVNLAFRLRDLRQNSTTRRTSVSKRISQHYLSPGATPVHFCTKVNSYRSY